MSEELHQKSEFERSLDELTCDDLAGKSSKKKKAAFSAVLSTVLWAILAVGLLGVAVWSASKVVGNLTDFSDSDKNYENMASAFSPVSSRKEKPSVLSMNRATYPIADYSSLIVGEVTYPDEPPIVTPVVPTETPVVPSEPTVVPTEPTVVPTEPTEPTVSPSGSETPIPTETPYVPPFVRDLTPTDPNLSRENVLWYKEAVAGMKKQYGNDDIFGWIVVPNTPIDYPIVRGEDNDYYLNHNPEKTRTGYGSIYLDYRNSTDLYENRFSVFYGHNIRSQGTMFNGLLDFTKSKLFQKNRYFYIYTENAIYKYEVFSCYVGDAADSPSNTVNYVKDDSFFRKITDIKNNSAYQREGLELYPTDRVVMLYTCANTTISMDRCYVFGVLVEMGT